MALGFDLVLQELENAGYRRLPTPLVVASASFEFDAALIGTGVSQDLVVIGGLATNAERLSQLLSGLNRSLDRLQSRRPVSLVLLGSRPDRSALTQLESSARVMILDATEPTRDEVRDAVAVLLPLRLPSTSAVTIAPLDDLRERLSHQLTNDHSRLIDAAESGLEQGSQRVREELQAYVRAAFTDWERPETT